MIRFLSFSLFLIVIWTTLAGQPSNHDNTVTPQYHFKMYPGRKLTEINYEKRLLGSSYLNDEWNLADIHLIKDSLVILGVDVKVDVGSHTIDVRYGDEVKMVPVSDIRFMIMTRDYFGVYYSPAGLDNYGPEGLYKVVYNGPTSLFIHYVTRIKEAKYNSAIDVGERDDEILVDPVFYTSINHRLVPLSTRKKDLLVQLNADEKAETFIKENNISIKDEKGLVALFKYLDNSPR